MSMSERGGVGSNARAQPSENCRWLWEALRNLKVDLVTSQMVPMDWDWNQIHPVYGTPLMAIVKEGIRLNENSEDSAPVWRLLRTCLAAGADPRVEAKQVTGSIGWGGNEQFPKIEAVKHEGHSAISLVLATMAACQKHQKQYTAQIANCEKMLKMFAGFVPKTEGNKVSVPEAVVDMWEAILEDEASTDVRLIIKGEGGREVATKGCEPHNGAGVLKAHRAVLRRASCVLDALLGSSMQEGKSGVIHVDGVSFEAARQVLQLIYTGTICDEPKAAVMLGVIDLAHRWQVAHVVDMAERALINLVSLENLGEICEAAVLKELPALRAACKRLAADESNSTKLQAMRDSLPPAVMKELRLRPVTTSAATASEAVQPCGKRRRRSL